MDKDAPGGSAKVVLMSSAIYKAKSQAKGHTEDEIRDFIAARSKEAQQLSQAQNEH